MRLCGKMCSKQVKKPAIFRLGLPHAAASTPCHIPRTPSEIGPRMRSRTVEASPQMPSKRMARTHMKTMCVVQADIDVVAL